MESKSITLDEFIEKIAVVSNISPVNAERLAYHSFMTGQDFTWSTKDAHYFVSNKSMKDYFDRVKSEESDIERIFKRGKRHAERPTREFDQTP